MVKMGNMVKLFWSFVSFQVILVLVYAVTWPDSGIVWILGFAGYLIFSFVLIGMSTRLGKENRTYYLVGLFGSYINWVVFGAIGLFVSLLTTTLGAVFF